MRRRPQQQPAPESSEPQQKPPPRFCPNCGAANPGGNLRCTICGHPFASREQVAHLWDSGGQRSGSPSDQVIDVEAREAGGPAQATIPIPAQRPYSTNDPWSSSSGATGTQSGRPGSGGFVPPPRRRSGPPGAFLGCLGLIIIGIVAAAFGWYGLRPFVSERVADEVGVAIEDELESIRRVPVGTGGRVEVTEETINATLRANEDAYEPATDLRTDITAGGIEVTFDLYGAESTLRGALAVENGRLVIVSPELDGTAGRFVDLDTLVATTESALNELLQRNRLTPTSVTTEEGAIVITTQRAAA